VVVSAAVAPSRCPRLPLCLQLFFSHFFPRPNSASSSPSSLRLVISSTKPSTPLAAMPLWFLWQIVPDQRTIYKSSLVPNAKLQPLRGIWEADAAPADSLVCKKVVLDRGRRIAIWTREGQLLLLVMAIDAAKHSLKLTGWRNDHTCEFSYQISDAEHLTLAGKIGREPVELRFHKVPTQLSVSPLAVSTGSVKILITIEPGSFSSFSRGRERLLKLQRMRVSRNLFLSLLAISRDWLPSSSRRRTIRCSEKRRARRHWTLSAATGGRVFRSMRQTASTSRRPPAKRGHRG